MAAIGKKLSGNIRYQDLIPKENRQPTDKAVIGLYIIVFELDKDKYPQVLQGLNEVNDLPVGYEDRNNFSANGLVSGGGDRKTWIKLAKILAEAEVRIIKRVSALIDENSSDDIEIAESAEPRTIRYQTADKAQAGIGLPQGTISLHIDTKSLIGLKQVCKLGITPVFKTKIADNASEAQKKDNWKFTLDSIAVNAPVRPGQFVFLSPDTENFPRQGLPVAGEMIFCSKRAAASWAATDEPKIIIRFCLIAGSLIND